MIFWLPLYVFIFYNLSEKQDPLETKNIWNGFLLILAPLILATALCFFVKPIGSISDTSLAHLSGSNHGTALLAQIIEYYRNVVAKNFQFNFNYLITTVPLLWLTIFLPVFIKKDKNAQNFLVYLLFFFSVITALHCNEWINSFNYLSYLIVPLVLLNGLILSQLEPISTKTLVIIIIIALAGLNLLFFKPAWVNDEATTIFWNKEYKLVASALEKIPNNSLIISNDNLSLFLSVPSNRKNLTIINADGSDLAGQIARYKRLNDNVLLAQGSLGAIRKNLSSLPQDIFEEQVKNNFSFEIIYRQQLETGLQYLPTSTTVFLYRIKNAGDN